MRLRVATLLIAFSALALAQQKPSPPMGWNSWDSWGTTLDEENLRGNAKYLAEHLKPLGWSFVTLDMEWFVQNPVAEGNSKIAVHTLDAYGRYIPDPKRFPSSINSKGLKPIGDSLHSLGLQFGIHILQGIPKKAVEQNLPIEGSNLHAKDVAQVGSGCRWNPDNWDVKHNAVGQAYYDSIARLYASWGVDLIKVDCIGGNPFKGDELSMLRRALDKTGRTIRISVSPGESPLSAVPVFQQTAQQWRISDDVWDIWHSNVSYPQGVNDQIPRLAKWRPTATGDRWPDADMLPLGYLGPAPGWGTARQTRLTHAEQMTMFSMWCIFRSPLMMGGDLLHMDSWTLSLLTNREVIAVDQASHDNKSVILRDDLAVWTAVADGSSDAYVAITNRADNTRRIQLSWKGIGLAGERYRVRDLWQHKMIGTKPQFDEEIQAHGTALLRLTKAK